MSFLRLLTATTVLICLGAAPAQAFTPEQALDELNRLRGISGLAAVTAIDPAWNVGCQRHNHYMALNGLGHVEDPGAPGYTRDGWEAGLSSVLAGGVPPEEALAAWIGAVFHRVSIFHPRLRRIGFDASEGYACLLAQGNGSIDPSATVPELTLYPSPGDGEQGIHTIFPGNEFPDPYDETGVNGSRLGWLLSVAVNGPWENGAQSHDVTATLAPESDPGHPVPIVVSQRGTALGRLMAEGFGIFPLQPLAPDTVYRATASGTVTSFVDDEDFHFTDFSWTFRTADGSAPFPSPGPFAGWPQAGGATSDLLDRASPDSGSPRPAIGSLRAGRPAIGSRRSVTVPLTCRGKPGARCAITVRLTTTKVLQRGRLIGAAPRKLAQPDPHTKQRTVTLAERRLTLISGSAVTLKLRLGVAGRRLLAALRRLPVVVRTMQRTAAGDRAVAKGRVTLTLPVRSRAPR